MTHAVVLMMLALPALQDDPQVVYREALFEEVDQGNPDKALELYGKILKGNAPDALKAKALYRSGHCHEKKGRRKEAEQAYRDVMERFSGEAATAKLARDRLAVVSSGESAGPVSLDAQIQVLILDLGSTTSDTRNGAVRKLTLLGESAIPELRRTLRHKDTLMCVGAARALAEMGELEGLYEAVRPHLGTGLIQSFEARVLSTLLEKRKEDRAKFLADVDMFRDTSIVGSLAQVLCGMEDPAFLGMVEDWLANPKVTNSLNYSAFGIWFSKTGDAGLARLLDRLGAGEKPQVEKIRTLTSRFTADGKGMPTDIQAALLRVLERAPQPAAYLEGSAFPIWMRLLNEAEFVRRVLPAWMELPDDSLRSSVLYSLAGVRSNQYLGGWQGGRIRAYLFDILASPKLPLEVRKAATSHFQGTETPAELEKYVAFCLDWWRASKGKPNLDDPSVRGVPISSALSILLNHLPPDSKDLPDVLESIIERRSLGDSYLRGARAAEIRGPLVAAALRNAKPDTPSIHLVLNVIGELGTPMDQVELGRQLASWPREKVNTKAVALYCRGVIGLPERDRSAAWKDLMAFYLSLKGDPKVHLVNSLSGSADPRVDEFMREAGASEDESVRLQTVFHWKARQAKEGVAPLIRALEDKSRDVKWEAIKALGELRALDAVPALIPLLEGDPGAVRDAATAALKLIRQHYEERAEWQRWYDEMKKTLKK